MNYHTKELNAEQCYRLEKKVNKQLFDLGAISKDERRQKDLRAKAIYISQKRHEE